MGLGPSGAEGHLDETAPVAQVHEDQAAEVAAPVYPAREALPAAMMLGA
jgi:hypothetical protein